MSWLLGDILRFARNVVRLVAWSVNQAVASKNRFVLCEEVLESCHRNNPWALAVSLRRDQSFICC
jgi:hypothetical protein